MVEATLGLKERYAPPLGEHLRLLLDLVCQISRVSNGIDQTPIEGFRGSENPSREYHFPGPPQADEPGKPLGPPSEGNHSQPYLREGKTRRG